MNRSDKIERAGSAARVILSFYKSCLAEETQVDLGKKIEKEHSDVYDFFSKHLKKHGVDMPVSRDKFFEMIARAHIKELPNYYSELIKMEDRAKKGKEAIDFSSIAPILTPENELDKRELARAIRLSISAEQDAVHLYELLADASSDEKVKKILQDIADEEKVHEGEFQRMLQEIDKSNAGFISEGEKEVEEMLGGAE
jgi:hypothetical protein